MRAFLPITVLALSVILAGCGADKNPVTGAYEALLKSGEGEPQYVGLVVVQDQMIWADGESVPVSLWVFEPGKAVAQTEAGVPIMTFAVDEETQVLTQKGANGDELILRKLAL